MGVNTSPDDPSSPFTLAGQATYYQLNDGSYAGIVSAEVGGTYYFFATLLNEGVYAATSTDGFAWPSRSQLTRLTFYDSSGTDVTLASVTLARWIAPNGQIWLLSNWNGHQARPLSTAIAIFAPSMN